MSSCGSASRDSKLASKMTVVKAMSSSRSKSLGSFNAYACLLAVALIYAQLIGFWVGAGACCHSNYCPIRAHHHQMAPASNEHHGMECEHDMAGMVGMANCSMSCCHDTLQAFVGPFVFVLQTVAKLQGLSNVARVSEQPPTKDILHDRTPLSPPPRLLLTA